MRSALFGIPLTRLMHAVYGAIRTRALVLLRRRLKPQWEDPLHDNCPRADFGGDYDGERIWVLAANQRQDLVRTVLAELSRWPAVNRPNLVIVACDPASREDLAVRAQDWRRIFGVSFEIWLPDTPPAPGHLQTFCQRISHGADVLLSPAEAQFARPEWFREAFGRLDRGPAHALQYSSGNPNLDEADRVMVAAWRAGTAHELKASPTTPQVATAPSLLPVSWAPVTTERLPALSTQPGRLNLQGWLYRNKETILSGAARLLLVMGMPRHKAYAEVISCFSIRGAGLFLAGSMVDPFHSISRITLAHPRDAHELDLQDFLSRVPQPSLDRLYGQFHLPEPPRGFVAFVPLRRLGLESAPTALTLYEYRSTHRRRLRVSVQSLPPGIPSLRTLLAAFSPNQVQLRDLMERQVAPAVQVLWEKRPQRQLTTGTDFAKTVRRVGAPPKAPRVSIVVPIYGRWDFMRYQMEGFRNDPTLRDAEWIYVIDDPQIGEDIVACAEALYAVFRTPFALVYAGENRGFSSACNLGARAARGDLLLLMNSDVFPAASGWIDAMVEVLAGDVGAVGARLLYEDNAVQHAGLAFESFGRWQGLTIITHPGKGLPDRLLRDQLAIDAGATAACLLLRRTDYDAVGGLAENFAIGDFEDGDLCARLRAEGKRVVTAPRARLYHLERQSIRGIGDSRWREMLTLYNCWLFNERLRSHSASLPHQYSQNATLA